jgi:hypothetical protein
MKTKVDYKTIIDFVKKEYRVSRSEMAHTIGCSTGYLNLIACGTKPSDKFVNNWIACYPKCKELFEQGESSNETTSNDKPSQEKHYEGKKRGRKPKTYMEATNNVENVSSLEPTPKEDVFNSIEAETSKQDEENSQWLENVSTVENSSNQLSKNDIETVYIQIKKKDERIEWLEMLVQDKERIIQEKENIIKDIQTKYQESQNCNSQLVMKYIDKAI